jgi:hypothetical protein
LCDNIYYFHFYGSLQGVGGGVADQRRADQRRADQRRADQRRVIQTLLFFLQYIPEQMNERMKYLLGDIIQNIGALMWMKVFYYK